MAQENAHNPDAPEIVQNSEAVGRSPWFWLRGTTRSALCGIVTRFINDLFPHVDLAQILEKTAKNIHASLIKSQFLFRNPGPRQLDSSAFPRIAARGTLLPR
jgi:hypothetical protein